MACLDLSQIFRTEYGLVLASLMCFHQDLHLAEDALQDTFEKANVQWPKQGVPKNCRAWLYVVAKRKMLDLLRQGAKREYIQQNIRVEKDSDEHEPRLEEQDYIVPDERLRLIFICCHPALNQSAQVALTLKTLCGLKVVEIARAYLKSEAALAKTISRAKSKIRVAGISYDLPSQELLTTRLDSVLRVIYLIYNESYSAYEGQSLTREDLAHEALRLSHLIVSLIPEPEVFGLAALLHFHDARRFSRCSKWQNIIVSHGNGNAKEAKTNYIPLASQDRKHWDKSLIAKGNELLDKALSFKKGGQYQIQAAISALHCNASDWQSTDWKQITLLYQSLYRLAPSPIVELNQLVAQSNISTTSLDTLSNVYQRLSQLQDDLQTYQPYFAAKAEFEARLGLLNAERASLQKAISLTKNKTETNFLLDKLNKLSSS